MFRKIIAFACTFALVAAVVPLTACGGGQGQNDAQEQQTAPAQQAAPEKPATVVLYTTDNVPLRKEASKKAEKIATIPVCSKVTVVEAGEDYTQVTYKDKTGYAASKFLTDDKAKAKKAKKKLQAEKKKAEQARQAKLEEQRAAEAAKAAAAAAAAKEAAAAAASKKASEKSASSSKSSNSEKASEKKSTESKTKKSESSKDTSKTEKKASKRTLVSKEKVPDCDDPEHGYYIYIYSDGTEEQGESY